MTASTDSAAPTASTQRFFADGAALAALAGAVRDYAVATPDRAGVLRIWVPGCGTGEEAFTIAAIVDRALRQAKAACDFRLFATDLQPAAVRVGATGRYPKAALQAIPASERGIGGPERDGAWEIVQRLRSKVLFRPHDLVRDLPIPRTDVICCRGALAAHTATERASAFDNLLASLRTDGLLLLGEEDATDAVPAALHPIDAPHRLYRRSAARVAEEPAAPEPPEPEPPTPSPHPTSSPTPPPSPSPPGLAAACASLPMPMLLLDEQDAIAWHNPAFAAAFDDDGHERWLARFDDDAQERLQRSLTIVRRHRGSARCQAAARDDADGRRWQIELSAVTDEPTVAVVITDVTTAAPRAAVERCDTSPRPATPTASAASDKQVVIPNPTAREPRPACAAATEQAIVDDQRARRHARPDCMQAERRSTPRPLRERLHAIRGMGQALARSGFDGGHRAAQVLRAFQPD